MQRNNVKTDFAICKLPRWVIITIRDVADYYSVDQASVLRACIQACERKDVLIELPKQPLPYLNQGVAYPLKASFEDQEHIRYWEERLSWTKKTVLASMIITGLPPVIERLKHSKPLVSRLIRNKLHQITVPAELRDSIFDLRDERGESPSLLLREALLNWRKRDVPPIPDFRNGKKLFLRLLVQEWERMEMIAVASEMPLKKSIASLFLYYFFTTDKR